MKKAITKRQQIDIKKAYNQKMTPEQLQQFMHFKKRGFAVPPKKGNGSYNRKRREKVNVDS